jgi:hypothetical protein
MSKFKLDMKYLLFAWQDDSPDNCYYLDTTSGDIKLVNRSLYDIDDLTDEIEKEHDHYLYLPKPDDKTAQRDLREFMETLTDSKIKKTLDIAFESPDVLGTFKKILASDPKELARFEAFRNQRIEEHIHEWLKINCLPGYE